MKIDFGNHKVAQMDIANDGRVTIYPQVTGQRVEFGKAENIEGKFEKLMIL
ncbi:MAG: hypothetical protein QM734_05110 [Cyclobacteriaceae bacterium]